MEDKQIAIFKQDVHRRLHYFGEVIYSYIGMGKEFGIMEKSEFIETKTYGEYEIDKPPFVSGDEVYLHDIDKVITINRVCRSTDGKFIYYAYYELINDDKTKESISKAKEDEEKYLADFRGKLKEMKEEEPKKKWYEFWK